MLPKAIKSAKRYTAAGSMHADWIQNYRECRNKIYISFGCASLNNILWSECLVLFASLYIILSVVQRDTTEKYTTNKIIHICGGGIDGGENDDDHIIYFMSADILQKLCDNNRIFKNVNKFSYKSVLSSCMNSKFFCVSSKMVHT